jgi:hypothetical protein
MLGILIFGIVVANIARSQPALAVLILVGTLVVLPTVGGTIHYMRHKPQQ